MPRLIYESLPLRNCNTKPTCIFGFDMKRESNENLSGNEVYYTACSLLVTLKNSCSKLHCDQGLNSIIFSYKIDRGLERPPGPTHTAGPGPDSERRGHIAMSSERNGKIAVSSGDIAGDAGRPRGNALLRNRRGPRMRRLRLQTRKNITSLATHTCFTITR